MSNLRIDILEEEILKLDHEVLERLLWDHSRPKFKDGEGNERHHHIYWATDMYEKEGKGFGFFDEIEIASVTGDYRTLVRPRAVKSKEEQILRTKVKAEVFTPAWICNVQVNLIDNAWFGREGVFNHENKDHTWTPNREKIMFPEGKTWKDYVWDKRLEITCGEAPYLVSRYDAVTSEAIDDLHMRIGILDRKLRVVSENVTTSAEWIFWGKCALKSTYGFEWQGDNILLARESLFYTFLDYYEAFCRDVLGHEGKLQISTLRTIAYIISWNIWQMDGLNFTLPMSGCQQEMAHKQQTPSLFDSLDEQPDTIQEISEIQREKIYALIADWQKNGEANKKIERFDVSIPKSAKK